MDTRRSGKKRRGKNVTQGSAEAKWAGGASNTTSSPMQTTDHVLQEDPGRVAAGGQYNQSVQEQEGFPREKFDWMTDSSAGTFFEADFYRRVTKIWCDLGGKVMELCSWQGMYHKDCPCRFCVFNRYHHQHEVSSHCNEEAAKVSKSAKRTRWTWDHSCIDEHPAAVLCLSTVGLKVMCHHVHESRLLAGFF